MMSRPALFDAAVRSLSLVLVVVAVFLASRWLTELTAPRPVAKLPSAAIAPPENSLKMVARLFGTSEARSQSLDGLQLAGVFAGSRGGGFATFRTRSGAISVFTGGEVVPGVMLKQIERDRVIILSAGVPKELRLSEGVGQSSASPAGQAPTLPAQAGGSGYHGSGSGRVAGPQDEEQ